MHTRKNSYKYKGEDRQCICAVCFSYIGERPKKGNLFVRHGKNAVYSLWFYLFAAGFITGVILMNLGGNSLLETEGNLSETAIDRLRYMEIDNGKFLIYVIWERYKDFLFLGIMSTTCFGALIAYLYVMWQGILTGIFMTALLIRFGTKGMLLILAGSFPHQLLLIPALIMMLYWCYQNCCFLYYPGKCTWPVYKNRKSQYLRQGVILLWIVAVVMIGCILECYVNPILISEILKIF